MWTSPALLRSGCVLPLLGAGLSVFRTGVSGSTVVLLGTVLRWDRLTAVPVSAGVIWIVPTLLAGDGEMESDRRCDLTRSQPHE